MSDPTPPPPGIPGAVPAMPTGPSTAPAAVAPPPAPASRPLPKVQSFSVLPAVYRLLLSSQITRTRLVALAALGVTGIVLGFAVGASDFDSSFEQLDAAVALINEFGLTVSVPITALIFASSALGDLTDDSTLVYLWVRPLRRWVVVVAAFLAALTVTIPLVVVPLAIAASLTGAGSDLVVGTVIASTLGIVAYAGIFTALGLRVRRALVWGLLYILIWEGFVARGGDNAARLAVRSITATLLQDGAGGPAAGIDVRLAVLSPTTALIAPFVVAAVALLYASWRLRRQDVA
jgi:ABC-2 type transport system permease protein